ncbi:hypothetical protein HN873_067896, partial [Arachis hypogaea]
SDGQRRSLSLHYQKYGHYQRKDTHELKRVANLYDRGFSNSSIVEFFSLVLSAAMKN